MPQKPGRTPTPPIGEEPKVARERSATEAHRKVLRKACSVFAKAAMALQECVPGTIGYRMAEQRAKEARTALEASIDLYVKRNRLDAHRRSYTGAEDATADALKHAKLSEAHDAIVRPIIDQLVRSHRGMREMMERQIADLDLEVRGGGGSETRS